MQLLKSIRFFILLAILLASLYFLARPFIFTPSGVVVTSVSEDIDCSQVKEGDIISQLNNVYTKDAVEFERAVSAIKKGDHTRLIINGGPGWCNGIKDGDIGISVVDMPSNQLKFGIELQGGNTITYRPTIEMSSLEEIAETIEKRIGIFELPETKVEISNGNIKIISLSTEKLTIITVPGVLETKILQEINLINGTGNIKIGNNAYPVKTTEADLIVNGSSYTIGEQFFLDGIFFDIISINESLIIEANIFTNEDVLNVWNEPYTYATYNPDVRRYEFRVQLTVTEEAIDRFEKILQGTGPVFAEGVVQLVYYLDGKVISSLPVEMPTEEMTSLPVLGWGSSLAEVTTQKLKVQAALSTDNLPDLEIIETEYYSPSLRSMAITILALSLLAIALLIGNMMYFRHRKIKLGGYMLLLIGSEIFCILGVASLSQIYCAPGWILDFPSILGLVSFLTISSALKILTTEKLLKNKKIYLRYKYKNIINVTSFLNILLLTVSFILLFTGWKGYGFSVFIGMLVAVLITNPIYKNLLKS